MNSTSSSPPAFRSWSRSRRRPRMVAAACQCLWPAGTPSSRPSATSSPRSRTDRPPSCWRARPAWGRRPFGRRGSSRRRNGACACCRRGRRRARPRSPSRGSATCSIASCTRRSPPSPQDRSGRFPERSSSATTTARRRTPAPLGWRCSMPFAGWPARCPPSSRSTTCSGSTRRRPERSPTPRDGSRTSVSGFFSHAAPRSKAGSRASYDGRFPRTALPS